jgi:hypothetical protein
LFTPAFWLRIRCDTLLYLVIVFIFVSDTKVKQVIHHNLLSPATPFPPLSKKNGTIS